MYVVGASSIVTGTALHPRTTTGIVVGSGSVVTGAAAHTAAGTHAASGAVVGSGSTVVGVSTRFALHVTTGAVTGAGATTTGAALRTPALVTHTTTGAVVGVRAAVVGFASGPATMQVTVGGWIERKKPVLPPKPKATLKLPVKPVTKAVPEAELLTLREELKAHKLAKQAQRRRNELALILR